MATGNIIYYFSQERKSFATGKPRQAKKKTKCNSHFALLFFRFLGKFEQLHKPFD